MKKTIRSFFLVTLSGLPIIMYSQAGDIRINQLGYYPDANKIAVVIFIDADSFEVVNTADSTVEYSGKLSPHVYWSDAGDSIKLCDFSPVTRQGIFKIRIPGFGESYPFEISGTVLRKAAYASLKSYYYQRCSYELKAEYAGLWARVAGHPDTSCIFHSSSGRTGRLSSPGGWYDAGDYGKYVVNAGISVATLLSFHENFSDFFADSTILIPESGNGHNDLLDEVKFELDWVKTMQDPDGGVYTKLTTLWFPGFMMPEADKLDRYVIGKSTAATLDFAAMMAMAGRIYPDYDSAWAADCITRAEQAWSWAKAHPAIYFTNPPDVSTGEYGDGNVSDEFIWAAAELYVSTDSSEYKTYLEGRSSSLQYQDAPGWPNVRPLASLSLATRPNGLSEAQLTTIKNSIVSTADKWLNQISSSPCRIPQFGYYWGSNSGIANIGVGLLYAYILTGDAKYIKGAAECADYLLGKNATGYSFVSSYGFKTPVNFHHRPSGSDGIIQPVPGFVSGGPNKDKQDGQQYPFSSAAKSYIDVQGSYASNEVCINWNSPLTALLAGVDAVLGDSSAVDFTVPTTANNPPVIKLTYPSYGAQAGSDVPFIAKGTATDADGIARVEIYVDARFMGTTSSGTFEWPVNSLTFSSHTLTILAYDKYELTSEVTNPFTYLPVHTIPGKVEAENYSGMSGVYNQPTSDTGGGYNVYSINTGDWFDYTLSVQESGSYIVEFRVSSLSGGGIFELRKMTQAVLASETVEATGGSQKWTTISDTVTLDAGKQKIRIYAVSGGWNINWINFTRFTPSTSYRETLENGYTISVSPNPFKEIFTVKYNVTDLSPIEFIIRDPRGRMVDRQSLRNIQSPAGEFDWKTDKLTAPGIYFLSMQRVSGNTVTIKLLKAR